MRTYLGPLVIHKTRACGPTIICPPVNYKVAKRVIEQMTKSSQVIVETYANDQLYNSYYERWKRKQRAERSFTAHFVPWNKGEDIMSNDQAPPKGGPISQINHGNTAPGAAGKMDHGTTAAGALAAKKTNTTVPVKIGSYPETGVPGQANKS